MNYNLLAYLIYGLLTSVTIFYVGRVLHRNGRHYVLRALQDEEMGDFINDGLLTGYYLFNLGYVFITIKNWERIENVQLLVELISEKTGIILLLLGLLHFFNIIALKLYASLKNIDLGAAHNK